MTFPTSCLLDDASIAQNGGFQVGRSIGTLVRGLKLGECHER